MVNMLYVNNDMLVANVSYKTVNVAILSIKRTSANKDRTKEIKHGHYVVDKLQPTVNSGRP